MKKTFLSVCCLLIIAQFSFAQVKFGIKAGMSSSDVQPSDLLVTNGEEAEQLGIAVENAKTGYHFGVYTRIGNKFFIQPEIVFNSNQVDYKIDEYDNIGDVFSSIKGESYQNIDIPIMLGLKYGFLRIQGGPVGHVHINSSSELTDISGYSQKFKEFTYGWQAGLGFDIWKLALDIKYEGNFQKYGDHVVIFGDQYNFDDKEGRFLVSLGWTF